MSVRIAVIDAHALSFGEAGFRQAAVEFREEIRRLGPRPAAEETEERGRRLRPRRACLERRRRAGAEDELPPPHSITASERARSVGGIVRPRDFAVLRLMTKFRGLCAGGERGRAPRPLRARKNSAASCAPSPWANTAGGYARPCLEVTRSRVARRVGRSRSKEKPALRRRAGFSSTVDCLSTCLVNRKTMRRPARASFRSTIRSEPMSSIRIVRGYFSAPLDRRVEN